MDTACTFPMELPTASQAVEPHNRWIAVTWIILSVAPQYQVENCTAWVQRLLRSTGNTLKATLHLPAGSRYQSKPSLLRCTVCALGVFVALQCPALARTMVCSQFVPMWVLGIQAVHVEEPSIEEATLWLYGLRQRCGSTAVPCRV